MCQIQRLHHFTGDLLLALCWHFRGKDTNSGLRPVNTGKIWMCGWVGGFLPIFRSILEKHFCIMKFNTTLHNTTAVYKRAIDSLIQSQQNCMIYWAVVLNNCALNELVNFVACVSQDQHFVLSTLPKQFTFAKKLTWIPALVAFAMNCITVKAIFSLYWE